MHKKLFPKYYQVQNDKKVYKNCDRKLWAMFLFKFVSIKRCVLNTLFESSDLKETFFFYRNAVSFP